MRTSTGDIPLGDMGPLMERPLMGCLFNVTVPILASVGDDASSLRTRFEVFAM